MRHEFEYLEELEMYRLRILMASLVARDGLLRSSLSYLQKFDANAGVAEETESILFLRTAYLGYKRMTSYCHEICLRT